MTLPAPWRLVADTSPLGVGGEPVTLRHPEPPRSLVHDFAPPRAVGWYALSLSFDGPGVADARLVLTFDDGTVLPQALAKVGRNSFSGLFRPTRPLIRVAVAVSGSAALDRPSTLAFRPVPRWEQRRALLRRAVAVLKGDPRSFPWRLARFLVQLTRPGRTTIPLTTNVRGPTAAYALWRERFDERPEAEPAFQAERVKRLVGRPLFTVMAGPDFDAEAVARLRASLLDQHYDRWELLTADPAAFRESAMLGEARGSFALLPRPGTILRPHALTVLALALDRFPAVSLVYADEDRLGPDGPATRQDPRFKPAWSPQRLFSVDVIGDLCAIALPLLRLPAPAEAFATGSVFAPAGRHDLMLRITEALGPRDVLHVAQILSHATGSPPEATLEARTAAIRVTLQRRGIDARVITDPRSPHPRVKPAVVLRPFVSLIIPTRDRAGLLRVAVQSIRSKTAYTAYEIIVVDNGSVEDDTFKLFDSWAGDAAIRVIRDDAPFNYARLNNRAAALAPGPLLGLVNNDVEARNADWLDEMVSLAMQPGVGCVGAKLWYPDGRLQHGGVVTGVAGAAGHRHKRARRTERGQFDGLVTVNEVSAVTAACLVVRKSLYDEVGGLDEERFAVAYNDVDLCLKIASAGYRNLWTPFAELVHHESVSRGRDLSPRSAVRFNREVMALRTRWGDRLLDDPYYSPNLTLDAEDGAIRVQ